MVFMLTCSSYQFTRAIINAKGAKNGSRLLNPAVRDRNDGSRCATAGAVEG